MLRFKQCWKWQFENHCDARVRRHCALWRTHLFWGSASMWLLCCTGHWSLTPDQISRISDWEAFFIGSCFCLKIRDPGVLFNEGTQLRRAELQWHDKRKEFSRCLVALCVYSLVLVWSWSRCQCSPVLIMSWSGLVGAVLTAASVSANQRSLHSPRPTTVWLPVGGEEAQRLT